jgi:hypothetical protein
MKSLTIFWVISLMAIRIYSQAPAGKDSSHFEPVPDTTKLEYRGLFLKPVEITAIRAGDKTPFTQITLGAGQIAKMNNGRDLPLYWSRHHRS